MRAIQQGSHAADPTDSTMIYSQYNDSCSPDPGNESDMLPATYRPLAPSHCALPIVPPAAGAVHVPHSCWCTAGPSQVPGKGGGPKGGYESTLQILASLVSSNRKFQFRKVMPKHSSSVGSQSLITAQAPAVSTPPGMPHTVPLDLPAHLPCLVHLTTPGHVPAEQLIVNSI